MKKEEQENEQEKKQEQAQVSMRSAELPPSLPSSSYGDDFSFHHLRAALALNNIGVSLLCKGSFSSAMKTFKDSLQVMKFILMKNAGSHEKEAEKEEEGNGNDDSDSIDKKSAVSLLERRADIAVQEMLQRASVRLATKCIPKESSKKKKGKRSSNRKNSCSNFCMVEICALDDTDLAAIRSAVRYGPTASMAFPIRCCTIVERKSGCNNSCMDDSILQYFTAMIRYNHGLAHLLLYAPTSSMASSSSSCSRKLLSAAFKHLSQAQTLLLQNVNHVLPNVLTATTVAPPPTTTTADDQSQQEQQEEQDSGSSSQQHDTNNNDNKSNSRRRRNGEDDDDADDQQARFVTSLLLLGLVFMSIHTFYRHKERPQQAQQVLESLNTLEEAIQEQQDRVVGLSSSLLSHLTRGACAA